MPDCNGRPERHPDHKDVATAARRRRSERFADVPDLVVFILAAALAIASTITAVAIGIKGPVRIAPVASFTPV